MTLWVMMGVAKGPPVATHEAGIGSEREAVLFPQHGTAQHSTGDLPRLLVRIVRTPWLVSLAGWWTGLGWAGQGSVGGWEGKGSTQVLADMTLPGGSHGDESWSDRLGRGRRRKPARLGPCVVLLVVLGGWRF